MKSVMIFYVFVASVSVYGVLGRSTIHKHKNDDHYIKSENDITNNALILPIEEEYKDVYEPSPSGTSQENIEKFYDMRSMYGFGSRFDVGSPYYIFPDTRYYTGDNSHDTETPSDAGESQNQEDSDVPDNTPQETTKMTLYEQNQKSSEQEAESKEFEVDTLTPYWIPPENYFNVPRYDERPYMMGIPAQLQSFPIFEKYYQPEYNDYYERTVEEERKRKELQQRGLDANTVENPELFPRGDRVRRSFSRLFNLREKNVEKNVHVQGKKISANPENVIFNADCRGRGRGGQNGNGGRNGGGADGVGNGIEEAAGTAQDAVGNAANAAGDAVDTIADAAENLRLANGRRGGRRNGQQRHNGRAPQQK